MHTRTAQVFRDQLSLGVCVCESMSEREEGPKKDYKHTPLYVTD